MNPVLTALRELQAVDLRLLDVRASLATFPKALSAVDARVVAARAEIEQSKASQLENLKSRKKFELDVDQWKEKAKKYKEQSYQVKTNEAFKALQHESQMAEDEIAKAEDRLLEQMVQSEEYDRKVKGSEKLFREVEEGTRRDRSRIQGEQAAFEKELAELENERSRILATVPEDLLDHYQRIARKHNGVGIAEIRDETCSACGVRIRPHVFQELRRLGNDDIFHCETCTRIIYYIEPSRAEAAASSPLAERASAVSNEP